MSDTEPTTDETDKLDALAPWNPFRRRRQEQRRTADAAGHRLWPGAYQQDDDEPPDAA